MHGVLCADVRDDENWTLLHKACFRGHKDVVQYLVEKANCDIGEYNTTPMHAVLYFRCIMYCAFKWPLLVASSPGFTFSCSCLFSQYK